MKTTRSTLGSRATTALILTAVAMAIVVLTTAPAHAAIITIGATAPVVNGADIANVAAQTATDKFWSDTRALGQTFTTGSSAVVLDAITLKISTAAPATKTYTIRVGSVSGTSFTQIASETGSQTSGMAVNDYITFTLSSPVTLAANTLYGFDVAMNSSTTGWQLGIPYLSLTANTAYTGGQAYRSQANGVGTPNFDLVNNDRVFHLNMAPLFADGVWTSPATGTWGNAGNWQGSVVASGAGKTANFSTINLPADVTVHLDSPRTIGSMTFGDTDTASAGGWTVDNNGNSANILTMQTSPTITVNALGAGKAVTISARLAGSEGLTKNGTGTLILSGPNTFTGPVHVAAGTLLVTGTHTGAGLYTVDAGARIGGTGTIGALNLFGTVAPGLSPGTLTAGPTTWNGGASYDWEINHFQGTAGADPGWDLLSITGTLTITATLATPFVIDINSLTLADVPGLAAGVLEYGQLFEIARAAGGIFGFDAAKFLLDGGGFANCRAAAPSAFSISGTAFTWSTPPSRRR
jgi:autotransporter-associated beta strand protein